MTVHQGGEVGLEHELVKGAGGGQTVVGKRQQSGSKNREVAHTCCSIRPCETSCTAVHPSVNSGLGPRARLRAALARTRRVLRLEDVHGPHYILPADGALAHPLPTFGARYHVTTFQQHAVDDGVHADATQVFISRQLSFDTICGWKYEKLFCSYNGSLQAH